MTYLICEFKARNSGLDLFYAAVRQFNLNHIIPLWFKFVVRPAPPDAKPGFCFVHYRLPRWDGNCAQAGISSAQRSGLSAKAR